MLDTTHIAAICHEANRRYRAAVGEEPGPSWEDATQPQRDSCIAGVRAIRDNQMLSPEASHASWLERKLAEGWTPGPVKDERLRQHPCCVPYAKLPEEQRRKDLLFGAIVRALI